MAAAGWEREIDTPGGPARAVGAAAQEAGGQVLVLGHGAGGGIGARDLSALSAALPGRGVGVILVEQPWRLAGRKIAGPPAHLDAAWLAVLADLAGAGLLGSSVIVGGRSAGARVACRTALAVGAAGALALAFPLHPPGRPGRSRVDELAGAGVPTLVVQGERDAFGGPPEFPAGASVLPVPHADHGFKVPARAPIGQDAALEVIVEGVADWLVTLSGNPPGP